MTIHYLQHQDIDKSLWDKCINLSVNGLVYPYSWYLDMVAVKWDALVLDDYKAVMPLPFRQRMGWLSVYQPRYAFQLGVFTGAHINPGLVDEFLNAIPGKYKKVEQNLNIYNKVKNHKWLSKQYFSYQLDLIVPYSFLTSKYSQQVHQTLWTAQHNKIQVYKQLNLKEFLILKKENALEPISFDELDLLRKIIPFCLNYNLGEIYGAYDENNMLVAAAFFVKTHQKSILLVSAQSDDGKDLGALAAILDRYIGHNSENDGKDLGALTAILDRYIGHNSEKKLTLDFASQLNNEDISLYTGLGAQPVSFAGIKQTRIPIFGKMF
jgi:hypothetical protein